MEHIASDGQLFAINTSFVNFIALMTYLVFRRVWIGFGLGMSVESSLEVDDIIIVSY